MSLNNILAAKSGITNIESRPNVILTYTGANASETDDIAKLLMRRRSTFTPQTAATKSSESFAPTAAGT